MMNYSLLKRYIAKLAAFSALMVPLAATAQYDVYRSNTWDIGLRIFQQGSLDYEGIEGSKLKTDEDWGIGFEFGYNFNPHFKLGFSLDYVKSGYNATIIPDDDTNDPIDIKHNMTFLDTHVNFTWFVFDGPLTPFVNGGIGFTYIDTNIAEGPPQWSCWWDPWWGYVCDEYQSSYDTWEFSYNVGVGVRWEPYEAMVLSVSYQEQWIDLSEARGTPTVGKFIFEIGYNY